MKIKQKLLCASLGFVMLFPSVSILSQGNGKTLSPIGKDGVSTLNVNSSILGIERLSDVPLQSLVQYPVGTAPSRVQRSIADDLPKYTLGQLNAMSVPDAMTTIMSLSASWQVSDLFAFSTGARDFYLNQPLMTAFFEQLKVSGETFTKTDMKNIPILIEIYRSGPYLGYGNAAAMGSVDKLPFKTQALPGLKAVLNNPNFGWSAQHGLEAWDIPIQDQMIAAFGSGVGSGILSMDMMPKLTALLKEFIDNRYIKDPAKANVIWNILGGIDFGLYAMGNFEGAGNGIPKGSQFYGHVTDYTAQLIRLAKLGDICYTDRDHVIASAIYWIGGNTGKFTPDRQVIADVLKDCLSIYPPDSRAWFQVVNSISACYTDLVPSFDGAALKKEVEAKAFTQKFIFDNGRLVFYVGPGVDPEKIKMLYWATKEVKAQFLRNLATDSPVMGENKAGATNDSTLIAYVYGSRADYEKYQFFLNGLGTANGGMYMEGWGKFFTYERTINESYFSLEDLFRHEFVHYLQGRFLCPGLFGGTMYGGDRLTWVEEGSAEFHAGSTRSDGVHQRWIMLEHTSSTHMKLADIVHASYGGGFTFYNFAYVAYHFMYEKHRDVLFNLHKLVQAGNPANFDAFVNKMAADYSAEYDTYLTAALAKKDTYDDIVTSYDYYKGVTDRNHNELFNEMATEAGMPEFQASKYYSPSFNTFELRGTVKLGVSTGNEATDRIAMDAHTDALLDQFSAKAWNGYKTVTAHFVNYKVVDGNATFDLVFKGLLPTSAILNGTPNLADANAKMLHNYPNPAKGTTTIEFSTTSASDVKLKLYTMDGRLIRVLVDRNMLSGDHAVEFSVSSLTNGVYFYILEADGKSVTAKMVVAN